MTAKRRTPRVTKRPPPKKQLSKAQKIGQSVIFEKLYVVFALVVVLATTLYWSILSAKIQLGNADQLVDPDLFKTLTTFRDATFPGAHTFLLKWPIFFLIKLFGSTASTIDVFTVGLVLLTVFSLVAIIYRIERRPIVFGTICLALASTLLLVPAEPYAGALLPVNMAMLATRNVEYIVFIVSLALLIRSPRIRSWGFWVSVACLSLLIASDKFFLIFALGGALISLILYSFARIWSLVTLSVNWFLVGLIAAIGAAVILAIIGGVGLTHISGQSSVSPYSLSSGPRQITLGVVYAVMGVLTNFGANPAFDATKVRDIPHQFFSRLLSLSGPAYAINLVIMGFGLFVLYKVARSSFVTRRISQKRSPSNGAILTNMLVWASFAALISFVATNHYYAVDARYLTIIVFTVFIAFSSYLSAKKLRPEILVVVGLLIVIGIISGLIGSTHNYQDDKNALSAQNSHNIAIAQVLSHHQTGTLVGDYWRVIPIKQAADNNLNVTPLSDCAQPRQILSSTAWQPNLNNSGFAYLLTLQGSLTNYPNCTLKQVVGSYGKPNASTLIAGTFNKPKELLLFYDRGLHKSSPVSSSSSKGPATVLPISLSNLPYTSCSVPSIMNIVAHEDDDLLFMNPDLVSEIKAGDCIRTIYVTAGNAGAGEFYWLSREAGAEAAYSYMLGTNSVWIQRIVELSPHQFITVANPKGNAKISLIFMYLPDGNLKGQGFSSSNFESLAKLQAGKINIINSVDNQSYYTSSQLINALSALMNVYQTTGISTQADVVTQPYADHSDHLTVSWYVQQAYKQFETQRYANQVTIPIKFYIGYPVRQRPANVSGEALDEKVAIFLAYAKHDQDVCQTEQICLQTPTYNGYLSRQYQSSY